MSGPDPETMPRRVLVVSADMGGGHHATGRALAEQVEEHWPGSEVRWVDTLDVMGRWVGPAFRRTYVFNVRSTPWLYEFFYASLWRQRWFADASKGFVAAWAGRRLARSVEQFDPDLILSTYPLGSAGLSWLRRHRSLPVPVGAWVSDFSPHPFWLYRDLDATYLMHDAAVPVAQLAEPGIGLSVTGPAVESAFRPGPSDEARAAFGLASERPVVLVSCGAYGFGAVTEAARAVLAADDRAQVVVACGRNDRLRAELTALGEPADRLRALGWCDRMPELTRAADLVVTNAGGATALEALATGRPVVMYRPIAAHGAANAALMSYGGLADTCRRPEALTGVVAAHLTDGGAAREAVREYLDKHDSGADLPTLAAARPPVPVGAPGRAGRIPPVRRAWPLRSPDAFFLHVQTHAISQQVGAVITAEPEPGAAALTAAALAERIRVSLPMLTTLRRRLVPRGDWRQPGWVTDRTVRLDEHVHQVDVADDAELSATLDRFWSVPVSLRRPPWSLLVIRRAGTDVTTVAFKMHHAVGDGMSLVGTMDRVLETTGRPLARRRRNGKPVTAPPPPLREAVARAGRVLRGMWELGLHARAPRLALNRPLTPNARGVVTVPLPTDEVRGAARAHRVRSSELLIGVVAEALHRVGIAGGAGEPATLRTMLPVTMAARAGDRTSGNLTGAVAVDLPVGPMSVTDRIQAIRGDLHRRMDLGEPHAAAFVMRALGLFPAPVHGWMSRRVYNSQFFNMITSYIAGPLHQRRVAGNRFTEIYPVVALAEGIPLGVGIMRYAGTVGVCVLHDASLARLAAGLDGAVRAAFTDLRAR